MSKKPRNITKLLCLCFTLFVLFGFQKVSVQAAGNPTTKATKKTLYVGNGSYQIELKNTNKSAKVTYKLSDTKIAAVTNKGVVTPKAAGKATITVTIKQNNKTYTSKITLTVANPYISIKSNQSEIEIGNPIAFTAKAVGLKKTNIVWSSSDSSIVKVDKKTGKVTGVKQGKAVITAKDSLSNKKSVLTVYVSYSQKEMNDLGYEVEKIKNSNGTYDYQMIDYTGKSKDLVIPEGITSIDYDFTYSNFNSVVFPNSITSLEGISFEESQVTKVVLPPSAKSIPEFMFSECSKLKEISLPSELLSIGRSAFVGCVTLESITLPKKLKQIGDYAFCECKSITTITIPGEVESVGYGAFTIMESLLDIICENDVNAIVWGGNLFGESSIDQTYLYSKGYYAMMGDIQYKTYETIQRTLAEINISEQDSDLEKIRKIHDWLVKNVSYSSEVFNEKRNAGSLITDIVLNDRFAVCEGYARTFNKLAEAVGIKSVYVNSYSMNHAWNMVLLDDGCWYHVDVTWDDAGPNRNVWYSGRLTYEYLILNDEQISKDHYGWKNGSTPEGNGTIYKDYFDHNFLTLFY